MVAGLSDEYLTLLQPLFSENGFKKIAREGVVMTDVDYGPRIDESAATAIIYTGAAPSVNGIFANERYDRRRQQVSHILRDTTFIGNTTSLILSPKNIGVSTLSDEIRLDASGIGTVFSIAPNASQAIISAGHAGNNAYWIDDKTGLWSTSSYYKEMATPMATRNSRRPLANVLDTLSWTPLLEPSKYPDLPEYKTKYPFKYTFPRKDTDRFMQYKESALVNEEITELACEFINTIPFGEREVTDMLNLTLTVAPYSYSISGDTRMESMDSYLRLDRDIGLILETIDKKIGLKNAFVFIAGYPSVGKASKDDEKWGVPSGEFSPKKAISLLNIYLMALHGPGNWVEGYFNRNFYLNQSLIKEKHLDLTAFRDEVAEFLMRMSGVSQAMTIDDILFNRTAIESSAMRRNISVKNSGDVIIDIIPGWSITDDVNSSGSRKTQVVRENYVPSTVMILSSTVKPQTIHSTVDARSIAPTVARLARFRTPNAASLPALKL